MSERVGTLAPPPRPRGPASFADRYGPWALVAGASEGLGAAFAEALAAAGLHVVLVARTASTLEALAAALRERYGVQVRTLAVDLGAPDLEALVVEATRDLPMGLLVYNAALAPLGPFLDVPLAEHLRALRVNCGGAVTLAWLLGRPMRERGRGGVIVVGSLAGFQGSALLSTYAATKAFDLVLAEGLWDELRAAGVDVLAAVAGATRTPRYLATNPQRASVAAPPEMEPAAVVAEALAALGRRPVLIAGRANRLANLVMRRVLPRRLAVLLMGRATRATYPQALLPPGA